MRIGGADHDCEKLCRRNEVIAERTAAGQKTMVLLAPDGAANLAEPFGSQHRRMVAQPQQRANRQPLSQLSQPLSQPGQGWASMRPKSASSAGSERWCR